MLEVLSKSLRCQTCIHATSFPTCLFCNSQSNYSFPSPKCKHDYLFFLIIQKVHLSSFFLWHLCAHRPAEFRDFYRKCQRHIPSQDTGAQVVFQDLSGGASLNRRGQEPQLCSCLQRYTGSLRKGTPGHLLEVMRQ